MESPRPTPPHWLTEDDVRLSLASLPTDTPAIAGLFGPGSLYWEVNKHALVYFPGALQAVLMQLAHPWIAIAVHEHSKIMSNPRQRARMTYHFLWSIIYGDRDLVAKRSLGLHRLHSRVTGNLPDAAGSYGAGSHYRANEGHAMLWVHVTAFYTRVKLYETLVRPLSPTERDRFCQEALRYALCFGIPETIHPTTWQDVEDYVARVQASDELATTEAGLEVSRFLEKSIPSPLRSSFWAFSSLTVPARTRELLHLPADNATTRRQARRITRLLRTLNTVLPRQLVWVPAYFEAEARITGTPPSWLVRKLNTAIVGQPRLVS